MIVGGGSAPAELRLPKDLAINREGYLIVVDAGLIKTFSTDGRLLGSFPVQRPESLGVLSDGRILVSALQKDGLILVFDREGKPLGHIGEPVIVKEASDPGWTAFFNLGNIVVDDDDNIYFIFRSLLTPTIRKYTSEGKLVAEWHPEGLLLERNVERAKAVHDARKEQQETHGGIVILTAGAFDSETKTLWVASGSGLMQLDGSGKTLREFQLLLPNGAPPLSADGLVVERDLICATSRLSGTFEFSKPH